VHRKYIPIYIQQDTTLHSLFISGNCSTCFGWYCAPDDGWWYHPKHVEQFPAIYKLCNVASCWIYEYIGILLGAHSILHINRIRFNGARGSKMVAQPLSMGKEPDASPHPLLMQTDTAHSVENLKKLNFKIFEHPLYSVDITPSDSPVWSSALVFINMKHTVRIIIDSPLYIWFYFCLIM
jgi:hypothetical protein